MRRAGRQARARSTRCARAWRAVRITRNSSCRPRVGSFSERTAAATRGDRERIRDEVRDRHRDHRESRNTEREHADEVHRLLRGVELAAEDPERDDDERCGDRILELDEPVGDLRGEELPERRGEERLENGVEVRGLVAHLEMAVGERSAKPDVDVLVGEEPRRRVPVREHRMHDHGDREDGRRARRSAVRPPGARAARGRERVGAAAVTRG